MASMAEFLRDGFLALADEREGALPKLEALYDQGIRFQDPTQTVEGREAVLALNRRLLHRTRDMSVEIGTVAESGEDLFLTWTMVWRPKLGPRIIIEGATHARHRDGRIVYHRDYWDLLSSVIDTVPMLGAAYHGLLRLVS